MKSLMVLIAMLGVATLTPGSAECAWCSPLPCPAKCLGATCVCVKRPGELTGECHNFSAAQHFRDLGYIVSE